MTEVVLTRRAVRDLDRLQPDRPATKLSDPRLGTFRYRIGSFRVVFDLDGGKVVVLRIGHRREAYRERWRARRSSIWP